MKFRPFLVAAVFAASAPAYASPIVVAGVTFSAGEAAFADDAVYISGPLLDPITIQRVLVGSDISDSFNSGDSNRTVIEVRFFDNAIKNDPGVDLVVFELSGDQPAGTADPREVFDIAVPIGADFSAFVRVTPIATGWNDPADSTLDVFAVHVDLSSFGVPAGEIVDRIRLGVFNANLGSKSADHTGVGALHSTTAIPEPSTAVLLLAGLTVLAWRSGRRTIKRAASQPQSLRASYLLSTGLHDGGRFSAPAGFGLPGRSLGAGHRRGGTVISQPVAGGLAASLRRHRHYLVDREALPLHGKVPGPLGPQFAEHSPSIRPETRELERGGSALYPVRLTAITSPDTGK